MTHASKHLKPGGALDWLESVHRAREDEQRRQQQQRREAGQAPDLPRVPVAYARPPPTMHASTAAVANPNTWGRERPKDWTPAVKSPAWATPQARRRSAGDTGSRPSFLRDPDPTRARRGKFAIQFTQKERASSASLPLDLGQARPAASPAQSYQRYVEEPERNTSEAVRPAQMAALYPVISSPVPPPSFESTEPAPALEVDVLQPFLPQDLHMPRVLLDPKWPGFRISALCLGSFDERGLGYFAVERDTHIQQGLMEFSGLPDKSRKGTVGIGGYAFDDAPGIKLSFSPGCISSLYWSPALSGPDEDPGLERIYLIVGTRWTPRFYAYVSHRRDRHVTSQVRVSAFDERHARQVPYLSRHFLVVVDLVKSPDASYGSPVVPASFDDFLQHCSSSNLPVPKKLERLGLHKEKRYSRDMVRRIDETLSSLSPTHAYQLEGILRDGTLTPHEVGRLVEEHVKVWSVTVEIDRDSTVEEILIEVRNQLVEDRKARAMLFSLGVQTPEQLQAMPFEVSHMADLAREAVLLRARVKLDEPVRLGESAPEKVESRTHFWCRGIALTPSGSLKVMGRMLEKSNATIRRYYHDVDTHRESDHFLRVAFREEDDQSLQVVSAGETGLAQKRLLDASVTKALKRGVKFAGRTYEFLAYSQSGLRDRSVWFVAPWEDVDRHGEPYTMTAERIRQQLGLFDKVNRQPAKLGARFSQGFTSSIATVLLHHTKIGSRPDIVERDDKGKELANHTDGAGVMSKQLREEVWQALLANGFHRDQDGPPPSVFQIRLGGSKGVIAVDDTLEGSQVQLRPSQDKFRGFAERIGVSNNFCLNVSDAFTRPNPLRLNRPLVSALEDLGIEKEIFLAYQKLAVDDLSPEALFSLSGAYDAVNKFSYGGASKFKSLLKSLGSLPGFDDRILREEPFLRTALDVIRVRCLRDLKDRARIPLPDSYVLVGVPDEDQLLGPNQVYACLRFPDRPDAPVYLKGRVLVTRSPAMDPGDSRVLEAVGRLPSHLATRMRSLENCLVLSTKGERSVASMMGGGDLDGDTYQVITLPELIPPEVAPPRPHEAQDPFELDRPAQIEDVSDCFVNYLCNDTVGQIAHLHLCLADRSPSHGFDPHCQQLADLYSLAVDAPKTGNVVPVEALPRVKHKARPDFMRRSDTADITVPADTEYYRSERALGYLHRSVDDSGVATPTCGLETAVEDGKSHSIKRVHITIKHDLAAIFDASPERLQGIVQRHEPYIRPILDAFIAALSDIAVTHTPPCQDDRRLSEVEIFAVATTLEVQRGEAARGNALAAMAQQVSALVEWLAFCLEGAPEADGHADVETLGLRYAAWRLASCPTEDDEEGLPFGVKTSRWVCLALLLESLRAENQRREDARLGVTRRPSLPTASRILHPAVTPPAPLGQATMFPARPTTTSTRSKGMSSASPRRDSLPSSESYKRIGAYVGATGPPLSSSTLPTSDELEPPFKQAMVLSATEQQSAAARQQPAASPFSSHPTIRISPTESSGSASGESTSAAAYIASLLRPQVTTRGTLATKASPPRAQPVALPTRRSDDSSDSLVAEAEHRHAYEELQLQAIELQRLRDEEDARERLYEEFRRRQHIKGIHIPSLQHDPHAYRAHREDFLASLRPPDLTIGGVSEHRPSSSTPSRSQEIESGYSAASLPPSRSGPYYPAATDRPRPPPTRYTPDLPDNGTLSRTPSPPSGASRPGWPTSSVCGSGSAYRKASLAARNEPLSSDPSGPWRLPEPSAQWSAALQVPLQEEQEKRPHSGGLHEWRSRSPAPPTPPPARREYFRDETPPFWALFDDVDKERYKSNQTGLGKLGRFMVTSDGQTYRDAYGLGKPTGPKQGGGRAYRSKGGGRRQEAETSWLRDTQRQVNDELFGWGQRAGAGGGGSRASESAWGAEASQRSAWK